MNLILFVKYLIANNSYCKAIHKEITPLSNNLKKVIVFTRHGDRAPITINDYWKDRACYNCNSTKCDFTECKSGILSYKGYIQQIALGKYMYNSYLKYFKSPIDFKIYSTNYDRTITSAKGFLKGFNISDAVIELKDDIVSSDGCLNLSNIYSSYNLKTTDLSQTDFDCYDKLMTSHCNNIDVKLPNKECKITDKNKFLKKAMKTYSDQILEIQNNIKVDLVQFNYTAKIIKEFFNKKENFIVVSSHDSIIRRIANGLLAAIYNIPPYSSSLAIELWEMNGKDVVRLVFNGTPVKFGFYDEEKVTKENFIKLIDLFGSTFDLFKPLCEKYNKELFFNQIINYKMYIDKVDELFEDVNDKVNELKSMNLITNKVIIDKERKEKTFNKKSIKNNLKMGLLSSKDDKDSEKENKKEEERKIKEKKEKEKKEKEKKEKKEKEKKNNNKKSQSKNSDSEETVTIDKKEYEKLKKKKKKSSSKSDDCDNKAIGPIVDDDKCNPIKTTFNKPGCNTPKTNCNSCGGCQSKCSCEARKCSGGMLENESTAKIIPIITKDCSTTSTLQNLPLDCVDTQINEIPITPSLIQYFQSSDINC